MYGGGQGFLCDKAPFITLSQADAIETSVRATGRKYYVYYSERLHIEAGMWAGEILRTGALGKVIQIIGWGPHWLSPETREPWFFSKAPVQRDPGGYRMPSGRAVSCLCRNRNRGGAVRQGGESASSAVSWAGGFRRDEPAVARRRIRLLQGGLVHPARPVRLGRRTDAGPLHRRIYRDAEIC